jgi:hypothetical protein
MENSALHRDIKTLPLVPKSCTKTSSQEAVRSEEIDKECLVTQELNNIRVVPAEIILPDYPVPAMLQKISRESFLAASLGNSNNIRVIPPSIQIPRQMMVPVPTMLKPISKESFASFSTVNPIATVEPSTSGKSHKHKKRSKKSPMKEKLAQPGTYHPPKEGKVNYRQKCVVPGCGSTCRMNRDRSFHNFPSSSRALMKVPVDTPSGEVVMTCLDAWLYKTQTNEFIKGDNYGSHEVCSKHFSPDDYVRTCKYFSKTIDFSCLYTC